MFELPVLIWFFAGEGVECGWKDEMDTVFMTITEPHTELKRVSDLVKNNILKKG